MPALATEMLGVLAPVLHAMLAKLPVAVRVAVLPWQMAVGPVTATVGRASTATTRVSLPVQPLALVTVTA